MCAPGVAVRLGAAGSLVGSLGCWVGSSGEKEAWKEHQERGDLGSSSVGFLIGWSNPALCWRGEGERSDKSVPAVGSTLASLLRLESGKFVPFVALRGLG